MHLCSASKYARYLGLVPIDDFDDKRTPDPAIHLPEVADEPTAYPARDKLELAEILPVRSGTCL